MAFKYIAPACEEIFGFVRSPAPENGDSAADTSKLDALSCELVYWVEVHWVILNAEYAKPTLKDKSEVKRPLPRANLNGTCRGRKSLPRVGAITKSQVVQKLGDLLVAMLQSWVSLKGDKLTQEDVVRRVHSALLSEDEQTPYWPAMNSLDDYELCGRTGAGTLHESVEQYGFEYMKSDLQEVFDLTPDPSADYEVTACQIAYWT